MMAAQNETVITSQEVEFLELVRAMPEPDRAYFTARLKVWAHLVRRDAPRDPGRLASALLFQRACPSWHPGWGVEPANHAAAVDRLFRGDARDLLSMVPLAEAVRLVREHAGRLDELRAIDPGRAHLLRLSITAEEVAEVVAVLEQEGREA